VQLFIADSGNMRVMRWTVGASQGQLTVPRHPDPDTLLTSIGTPYGLSWSGSSLYVAENSRHRVMKWTRGAGWCEVSGPRTRCPGGRGMISGRQTQQSCRQIAAGRGAVVYSFIANDNAYSAYSTPDFCGVTHPVTGADACISDLLPNCQVLGDYCANEQAGQSMDWRMWEECGEPVAGRRFLSLIGAAELDGALDEVATPTDVFAVGSTAYISDRLNDRVVKWVAGLTVDGTGVSGVKVAGSHKCLSSSGMNCAGLEMLDDPEGLYVDASSSIVYVVDSGNHRVVSWSPGASRGELIAGTGVRGQGGDQLDTPTGIAVDWTGAFYIADTNNHRVVRWELGESTGRVVAGLTGIPGSGLEHLYNPSDVELDMAGNLYVADTSNHRVVKWCVSGVTDLKCASDGRHFPSCCLRTNLLIGSRDL
jgi:sugar lactone lactonase YvrE